MAELSVASSFLYKEIKMKKAELERMAKECIKRSFHDCKFLYTVKPSDVKLLKGTNTVLINNKTCDITATRTVKTVLNDKKKCVSCNKVCEIVAVVINNNTGKKNVKFLVKGDGDTLTPLTKDHIIAKARGGTDNFDNLQSMCSICNTEKADTIVNSLHDDSKEVLIYRDHYDSLIAKQKDFSYTRKQIKKLLHTLPWYMKLIGVHKLIEKRLKEPLQEKGYYQPSNPIDNQSQ